MSAAVKREEQVQSLSKLGINVIQLDLSNEAAVNEAVLRNESVLEYQTYQTRLLTFLS